MVAVNCCDWYLQDERNDFMKSLSLLPTGGEITSTFDCPEKTKLGQCDLIEEVMIGEDKLLKFSGNKLKSSLGSIVVEYLLPRAHVIALPRLLDFV